MGFLHSSPSRQTTLCYAITNNMGGIPDQIGKYKIESLLGRGGMGEVFKAQDSALGRYVALKIMRGPALDDVNARERFIREAQSAGGLRHPNIVTVYDLGEFEDRMFIAMEFIHGEDLEHLIKKKSPLTLEDKFSIMIQVAEGVGYAHKHQIVHRDLKPSNIRIDDQGIAKIMDFGIAKLESSNMTASGTVMGTPYYMSPEQVRGMKVDGRSDIFSLGAILYELFAYRKAFEGELATVFFKIVQEQPPLIQEHLSIPAEPIQKMIDVCLDKDKAKRYQTVNDFIEMLRKAHQFYLEKGLVNVTGLKTDPQENLDTYRMAPTPAAVKPRSLTNPPSSSAPTQMIPAPSLPASQEGSAPTVMLQKPALQKEGPPPVPEMKSLPSIQLPTVAETAPRPVPSKAPWIVITVVVAALIGSGLAYFLFFREEEPKVENIVPPPSKQEIQQKEETLQKPPVEREQPPPPLPVVDPQIAIAEAKSLHQQGKYADAVQIYVKELEKTPSDANLHFLMGVSKKSMGKNQEALLEFEKAVELDDRQFQSWEQIGFLLINRMDYRKAENAFIKATTLKPDSASGWEGLAQTYFYQQKRSKAEEAYTRLLELEPANITAAYNLGLIQLDRDKESAKQSFKKVIELNPNFAEAYNNLGSIYLFEGNVAESIQENEKALQLKPDLASAHYSLFKAYELQGNRASAADHLKKYLDITGDDDPALKEKLHQLSR